MIITNFTMSDNKASFTLINNNNEGFDFEIESIGIGHTSSTDPWDLFDLGFNEDEVEAVDEFLDGLSSMLMINSRQI